MSALRGLVWLALWCCSACDSQKPETKSSPNEPSPNASILPAPLATDNERAPGSEQDASTLALDGGNDASIPDPEFLREDRALPSDSIAKQDSPGLTLSARFRWPELEPMPRFPETNSDALQKMRDQAEFEVTIDLWQGRMRFGLASRTFTLPAGSELRSRDDLYGHALIWPVGRSYSLMPPGTLRALFADQRSDMSPLFVAKTSPLGTGHLLGFPTERTELTTAMGRLELEQGRVAGTLPATASLCRLLVELVSAQPSTRACRGDLVPLRAEFTWQSGGKLLFEVQKALRKSDYPPSDLLVPPHDATFRQSELPPLPPAIAFSPEALADLRTRAVTVERLDSTAPKLGLVVANFSSALRYVLLDSVPVARVRPGTEVALSSLKAGKYVVSARDFFGAELMAPKIVDLPARLTLGDELKP